MRKVDSTFAIAMICVCVFLFMSANQTIKRVVVCLYHYTYELESGQVVIHNKYPTLDDPPLVILNVEMSFYQVQKDQVDPVWMNLFGKTKQVYLPKNTDFAGVLSKGVIFHLEENFLGCEWVQLKVSPS